MLSPAVERQTSSLLYFSTFFGFLSTRLSCRCYNGSYEDLYEKFVGSCPLHRLFITFCGHQLKDHKKKKSGTELEETQVRKRGMFALFDHDMSMLANTYVPATLGKERTQLLGMIGLSLFSLRLSLQVCHFRSPGNLS